LGERDEEWDKGILLENMCFGPKNFQALSLMSFSVEAIEYNIMKNKTRMVVSVHGPWVIVKQNLTHSGMLI